MRMRPRLATTTVSAIGVALLACALGVEPAAVAEQQPAPPKGTAFVVGQVVDGSTGRGVGGALVTMTVSVGIAGGGAGANAGPLAGRGLPTRGGQPPPPTPNGGPVTTSNTARVLADGEGRFLFHDLPAGRVSITASASGYSQGGYGARRPNDPSRTITLTDGQRFPDATVRLWKNATVSGNVVDETGEPLVGITVTFLRFQTVNGVKRTTGGPNTTTDDRGAFHFTTSPGDFLLVVPATSTSTSAASFDAFQRAITTPGVSDEMMRALSSSNAPFPSTNGMRVGTMQFQPTGGLGRNVPPIGPDGSIQAYQTTYYPSAVTPSQAQVITLAPGEERANLDLTMRLNSTSRVMGTVSGPDGTGGNLGVKLVVADSRDATFNNNYPTANTLTDPTGTFTFLGVPAGQYELQITRVPRPEIVNGQPPIPGAVTAPTLWARVPVSVGAGDVAGVTVALRQGVRISGRIEFDGASTPKPTDRLAQTMVTLQDLDNQAQPVTPTRVAASGEFTTQGVLPGHYLLQINGSFGTGWFLKSAVANNRDYVNSPQMLEGDVTNVIVTYTDHPNQLDGSVQITQPAADNPVMVVIFPANYQDWLTNGTAGRLSRTLRPDENAHFTLKGLPAGDYFIAALPIDFSNQWQDAKTLEAIARGATRFQIGDDDHRSVDLKPVTIR